METLTLTTHNAQPAGSPSNVWKYKFSQPVKLDGMVRLANAYMWYNWKNITADLKNNKFSWAGTEYTMPDGSYGIDGINYYIKYISETKHSKKLDYDILVYNSTYNRITFHLKTGDSISFHNRLAYILGITDKSDNTQTFSYADYRNFNFTYLPKIENVEQVQIHCNLVHNTLQSDNKLLYAFTPSVEIGRLIALEPFELWKNTRQAVETEITITLTDQNGNSIKIEDDASFTIVIKHKNN